MDGNGGCHHRVALFSGRVCGCHSSRGRGRVTWTPCLHAEGRVAASQAELSPLVRGPAGSTPSPEPFSHCPHGMAGTWPESWGRSFLSSAFQDGGGGALGQVSQLSLAALCWLVVLAFLSSPHQWKPTFLGSLVFPFGVHRPRLFWSFRWAPGSPQESVASAREAATF